MQITIKYKHTFRYYCIRVYVYCQINVILVSSEHTFPYSLESLGFSTLDISQLIFAGEVRVCFNCICMYIYACAHMYIHVSFDAK